ncbi:MAG: ANTAR domain-containing protein [Rhodococcus sp. (in: high G+C Gram-positive bacteria)]
MNNSNGLAPVTTHLASVSRMLTDADRPGIDEICAAAAEQAMAMVDGTCAGVVLASGGGLVEIASSAHGTGRPMPDAVLVGLGTASIEHNAVIVVDDTGASSKRWAETAAIAADDGIAGVRAFPVRRGSVSAGSLVVGTGDPWVGERMPGSSTDRDPLGVQVLADLVGIALRLSGDFDRPGVLSEALKSRTAATVTFERAVGILAERHQLNISGATDVLRGLARRSRRPVAEVAAEIVSSIQGPTS